MTDAKFTPGPWSAVNIGADDEPMMEVRAARIAGQPPRHSVAICATGDSPQWMEDANARLIAAAPDLYAALDEIADQSVALRQGGPSPEDLEELNQALNYAVEIAVAALAKARGES